MERHGRPMGGFASSPVKVGDELDVKIEGVGEKGDGLAKKDGFVLFVPNTKQGDQVKVKVTRVLRNVGFAQVIGQGEATEGSAGTPPEGSGESFGEESTEEQGPSESQDSEDF